jgi:MFS family permease
VAQFPANWLIQRYPVGKLVGICCFSWGVLTMLMGVTHNAAGLLTLRFFLGIAEAVVFPANAIITVMWYKQKEQPVRAAIWLGQWSSVSCHRFRV